MIENRVSLSIKESYLKKLHSSFIFQIKYFTLRSLFELKHGKYDEVATDLFDNKFLFFALLGLFYLKI